MAAKLTKSRAHRIHDGFGRRHPETSHASGTKTASSIAALRYSHGLSTCNAPALGKSGKEDAATASEIGQANGKG